MKQESLAKQMHYAFHLSCRLVYADLTPDGNYFTPRDPAVGTDAEQDMIIGWADGLSHKYYEKHATGRCSLSAMVEFDLAKFEALVLDNIVTMERLLKRHGGPVTLTKDEMRRRGYVVA